MLRSSSIPTLGALIAEGDHRHDYCSLLLSHCAHRSSVFGMPSRAGLLSKPSLQLRRARSETDLQGLLCIADVTQQQSAGEAANNPKHHRNLEKLSIIEESDPSVTVQVRPTRVQEGDLHSRSRVCSGMFSSHISPLCENGRNLVAEIAAAVSAAPRADDSVANFEGGLGGRDGNGGGYIGGPSGSSHGDADLTDLRYRKLLQSDPQNPLLLRNYAHYLSEMKHDYKKSEEYYERAILACPSDGEVLSTYAKHVWDVHKDSKRAGSYFNQAVKATPDDCYVLASHASFLWQCEEDEEVDDTPLQPVFRLPSLIASA